MWDHATYPLTFLTYVLCSPKMMPMSFDPDSNWAIEVVCDAPTFRRPSAWPRQCDNAEVLHPVW